LGACEQRALSDYAQRRADVCAFVTRWSFALQAAAVDEPDNVVTPEVVADASKQRAKKARAAKEPQPQAQEEAPEEEEEASSHDEGSDEEPGAASPGVGGAAQGRGRLQPSPGASPAHPPAPRRRTLKASAAAAAVINLHGLSLMGESHDEAIKQRPLQPFCVWVVGGPGKLIPF
jgi:hypothetical protein